jgi:hypothetical protein
MTVWDFDHCNDCKRFRTRSKKGLNNWGCAHNEATAKERRDFGMIWAIAYLQDRGLDTTIPEVEIIPVSKRKKKG